MEERQRAERRTREAKDDKFIPKWFDLTREISPTPWGDLEVYEYNGKYAEHCSAIDNSDSNADGEEADDVKSTEFNPWQY